MTNAAFDATREEIELVCSYMSSDQAVAKYFGIDPRRVRHIRDTMKSTAEERRITSSRSEGTKASSGETQMRLHEEEAATGSRQLRDRINKMFRKWEWKHGFKPGAAEILLPAGYRPQRQTEAA
jgi:hypothetical protein